MAVSKLILACEKAAELAYAHAGAVRKAITLFELKYGKEPDEDSAFMAWIHYGEKPDNVDKMNLIQGKAI